MGTDDTGTPNPEVVKKLVNWDKEDAELEARRQEIGMQIADLSAQLAKAEKRGDTRLCEEIETRIWELIKTRRQFG